MNAREKIERVPSDAAHAVVRQLRREFFAEIIELLISLGVSVRESSYRGDMWLTAHHLAQERDTLREAFAVFRALEPSLSVAIFDRNKTGEQPPSPQKEPPDG